MMNIITDFMQAILSLDRITAKRIFDDQCHRMTPIEFIDEVIVVTLDRLGVGWQEGTIALSQVYMGGRICEDLVNEILPPGNPERRDQPKMAVCVLSDHHQLGKIIVYSLLRASGFDLSDYGIIEVDDLIGRLKNEKIEILLISVLMLPSALQVKKVTEKLAAMDLDVKIIVGGAPFRLDDQLWQEVGATGMCRTASEVVTVVHQVMGGVS